MTSSLEEHLALSILVNGLPKPEREYRFDKTRRFRFDFAWPEHKVAAEIEGGTWTGGRHTRGKGFELDCEKYNLAVLAGWRVLRFTEHMVRSGEATATIKQALSRQEGA